ncbi:MAG: undecaprenyldiphospho-muramoylpentapeptide beta-N-acetylglucosaminyltransferase [Dictyoglomaceae bacterium]
MKNIVFVAGGTGGHLYPALYLAEYIKKKDATISISFIGRKNGIESKFVPEYFPFFGISLPRASQVKLWDYLKAYLEARNILNRLSPNILIIFGSFISIPILLEAILKKYPFFLHEQNVIPGRVVKIFSPFAEGIAISFLKTKEYLPTKKIFYTGNFVRTELLTIDKERCKKELGFNLDKRLLLVTGGSQGAKKINEIVKKLIPKLLEMEWQILHQVGDKNYEEFIKDIPKDWVEKGYRPVPFIKEMEKAIRASDFAISRAGATTIYQFLIAKLPAIYIPYPYAKDNHQEINAKLVVENGAGDMIREENLSEKILLEKILEWKEKRLKSASENCSSLVLPDSRERFWEIISRYLEGRN